MVSQGSLWSTPKESKNAWPGLLSKHVELRNRILTGGKAIAQYLEFLKQVKQTFSDWLFLSLFCVFRKLLTYYQNLNETVSLLGNP